MLAVREAESQPENGRRFLEFEVLTFAPIDRRLVVADLLTVKERDWLNAYHVQVWELVSPALDAATKGWLRQATEAI